MDKVNHSEFWEAIYQQGRPGWDLGGSTPVFHRLLRGEHYPPGKLLVLGAGYGHDARLFARHGFEVTAVDFAAEAVQAMHDLAEPEAPVEVVQADLFDLPSGWNDTFDYVIEHICFCAIDPGRRGEYAAVVARLLKPGGTFIGLFYPIDDYEGGPPFAVALDEVDRLFSERGFFLTHRECPPDSVEHRRGREELLVYELPEETL